MSISDDTLIMDIETRTYGKPDATKDRLRIFGCYSYKTKKIYLLTKKEDIQKIIDSHKYLVGFNNVGTRFDPGYDNPILIREGINLDYKIFIDLMSIFKNRASQMKIKKGMLGDLLMQYKLDYIVKTLGIVEENDGKMEIDYTIFQKDTWTKEEADKIKKYTKQDIIITKKLYEWVENYFDAFKPFLNEEDVKKKKYLTSSIAKFAYKAICKAMNWNEEYGNAKDSGHKIGGGYVSFPSKEVAEGDIYCLDYNCLPEGEYIYTVNGYKKIENINIGDETISLDGKKNIFSEIRTKNATTLIEIELKDGTIIRQTPEHRIPTSNGVKQAKNITKKDKLIMNNMSISKAGNFNELIELLGIFVCEGSMFRTKRWLVDNRHPKGRYSTINQTNLSIKLYENKFKKHIEYLLKKYVPYDIKFKKRKKNCIEAYGKIIEHYNIYDTRKEVYDWFENLKKKYYNLEYLSKNKGIAKSFLSGIFKSDATWNIKRHTIELRTTDEFRFNIIKKCLEVVGIYTNNYKCTKRYGHCRLNYIFEICYGSEIKKIFKWFQWDSYRDNKITKIKNTEFNDKKYNITIRNVRKIYGNFKVYDLTMQRQESPYFIHNGIFTHNSLYPHIMIQCNLYGRQHEEDFKPIWDGNEWKVEGKYYSDNLSGVCELFKQWYADRVEYKKVGDRREFTLKIILNASYGILNTAYYAKVFDRTAGGDCTRIGRQWIKYARKKFRDAGYEVIYTDTDSVYIEDPFNDKEKLLKVKDEIISDIKATVPFPCDNTFDMGIDDEIKYMYFFKGQSIDDKDSDKEMDEQDIIDKPKGFMKKNYIYVTRDGKVVIKNLGIKKKSNSLLSRKIFWEYLVPEIKKGTVKFQKTFIRNKILELLEKDITLAAMRKDVGRFEQYQEKSPTSLPAQVSKKYGAGIHFLIPNTRNIGVGKGKSYCTIEEFKAHNLTFDHIDLDNVWKELDYFVVPEKKVSIWDF